MGKMMMHAQAKRPALGARTGRFGLVCLAGFLGLAAASPAMAQQQPQFPNMSFFVSSTPGPDGGNFGGLEGADAFCQDLAAKAGAGAKTWRAYLSQQAVGGKPAVNARDRIGKGPWQNSAGVEIAASVEALHTPAGSKINAETGITEKGQRIPVRGFVINYHDIITGSNADGTAPAADKDGTCQNWTSGKDGSAIVGHSDRMGLNDSAPMLSWNSSHPSRGCDNPSFRATGGNGLLYCFAQ